MCRSEYQTVVVYLADQPHPQRTMLRLAIGPRSKCRLLSFVRRCLPSGPCLARYSPRRLAPLGKPPRASRDTLGAIHSPSPSRLYKASISRCGPNGRCILNMCRRKTHPKSSWCLWQVRCRRASMTQQDRGQKSAGPVAIWRRPATQGGRRACLLILLSRGANEDEDEDRLGTREIG